MLRSCVLAFLTLAALATIPISALAYGKSRAYEAAPPRAAATSAPASRTGRCAVTFKKLGAAIRRVEVCS